MTMGSADVFIPCYGYGHFLGECIDSVLSQPLERLRVLILDDCSPDGTPDVASDWAARDKRVEYVRHPRNRGHIATYNEGLEWAAADYVLLLSADDLLAPNALRRAVDVMDAHPEVVLTYGDCLDWFAGHPMPDIGVDQDERWTIRSGLDFLRDLFGRGVNLVPTPTAIVRTGVHKRVGGYRAQLPHAGDLEMWLRLAAHGAVASTPAVQAIKRSHGANMSLEQYGGSCTNYEQCRDAFTSFFDEYRDRSEAIRALEAKAMGVLANRAFWTGAAQMCRGQRDNAIWLYRYATGIDPTLRYRPPLSWLLRDPRAGGRALAALRALLGGART